MKDLNETDQEFKLFASSASYVRKELEQEYLEWQNSPFEWILRLPAGSKGKLGKHLISQWCVLKGLSVGKCPDSDADIVINGHRVEIKFSTLWKTGIYKFQQIRDQNYEYAICLGISPFEAHCWIIPKKILLRYVIGHLGQHTGREGQDTSWITIRPINPPEWLKGCGGSLEEAYMTPLQEAEL